MFKNYLKTAWRNLMKNKVFSLINILGLTIGITVCMMIFLFIMNEFSVDNFQKNDDIKQAVRVMPSNDLFVIGNRSFNEKKVYIADSNFFSLFSFPLLFGNAA